MRRTLLFLMVALALIFPVRYAIHQTPVQPSQPCVETTLSILRKIPKRFLVTSREEQLSVSAIDDAGWLLGPRKGMASIRVTMHYGVDLKELGPDDVRIESNSMRITLPEPKLLSVDADLSTYRLVTKTSGMNAIVDAIRNKPVSQELFEKTTEAIEAYRSSGMYPEARTEIVDRLNREVRALLSGHAVEVTFQ